MLNQCPVHIVLVQLYVEPGKDFNVQFVKSFLALSCSSKSFLNFSLSSTRLLIKWFLIKGSLQPYSNFIQMDILNE